MSDKIKAVENKVVLTGVISEIEVKKGVGKKENKSPYVSVKGEIQFGTQKSQSRRFEAFVQQEKTKGGENGLYQPTLDFANSVKSVAKDGFENATFISIQGELKTNDYVDKKDTLQEGLTVKATFFNDVDAYDPTLTKQENLAKLGKGTIDVEGYIQSIVEETKGEEQTETGRLKMTLLTTDFFGNLIPVKNIIVPTELAEAFQEGYEATQTALFFLDYIPNKSEGKVVKSGGLGKQRETDGKTYVEMVVTGAKPAVDEDDTTGISTEAIQIAMKVRKQALAEMKDKGYQGSAQGDSGSGRTGISSSKKPNANNTTIAEDDDIPF